DIFKFESACTASVRHRVWHHYATVASACDLAITGIGANPGTTSNAAPARSFLRRERAVLEYADIDCAAGRTARRAVGASGSGKDGGSDWATTACFAPAAFQRIRSRPEKTMLPQINVTLRSLPGMIF